MSGGRVALGIGVGWLKEEFEAPGRAVRGRGKRTDEYIAAMRALWPGRRELRRRVRQLRRRELQPEPPRHVPFIIGGHSEAPPNAPRGWATASSPPPAPGRHLPLIEWCAGGEGAGRDPARSRSWRAARAAPRLRQGPARRRRGAGQARVGRIVLPVWRVPARPRSEAGAIQREGDPAVPGLT